jgi:hypothetical protein
MPFEYRPFVNPYVSSMSDLMGRGVEARSRAELTAAEAQAGAVGRLGDITAAKWSGLGDTLAGGIDAYMTEQREKPMREHALWQMEQDKIAAERAEVMAGREDVEWGVGVQERQRDATRDRILATAQTRFTGPNGEVDAEGATAWVQEQFALQLPPSYLEAYQVRQRATEEHDALMTSHAARAEEAKLGSDAHRLEIERQEEADRLFEEMTRIDDTHGLDSPESNAAHRAYYGYTRATDPRIAIREAQKDRDADADSAGARTATEIKYERDFLAGQYRGALESRDPAVIHAIEQKLYDAQIDPRTLRHSALQESYDEAIDRHNARVGTPGGMYGAPGREEISDFDTWMRTADLPGVSTMGSVYAPPPQPPELPDWRIPMPTRGVITESELAVEVEKYDLVSLEEAAADYRNKGINVVEDDGSPSQLGSEAEARRQEAERPATAPGQLMQPSRRGGLTTSERPAASLRELLPKSTPQPSRRRPGP